MLSKQSEKFLKVLLQNEQKDNLIFLYTLEPSPNPSILDELNKNEIICFPYKHKEILALTQKGKCYFQNKKKHGWLVFAYILAYLITTGIAIAALVISIIK